MKGRTSVSLSIRVRGDMLHSFFSDISRQPRIDLKVIENHCALDIYGMIYGGMVDDLDQVPNLMFRRESTLPLPCVVVKKKKAKRTKGSIESTIKETFQFREFRPTVDIANPCAVTRCDELDLGKYMPQAVNASRWGSDHLPALVKLGLVNKTMLKAIEARYIRAVKDSRKVIKPVVEAMDGVTEILTAVKTSKGLLTAWPGCEKYLTMPEGTSGVLVKVNIAELDATLASLYPPAEKTGLTEQL